MMPPELIAVGKSVVRYGWRGHLARAIGHDQVDHLLAVRGERQYYPSGPGEFACWGTLVLSDPSSARQ